MASTLIASATTVKELGLSKTEVSKITKMYNGNKTEFGLGVKPISENLGISRRKVMRALEITGNAEFSPLSYT